MGRRKGRSPAFVVLAESRGRQFDSEGFAHELARVRDSGVQQVVICIGPADGWPAEAIRRADLALSFGLMTLPHELAAVVAAEQIYRATTIWSGHPYHSGH
jgi:23S rRNA (pseudouridine1915-N3)-methyltransferase